MSFLHHKISYVVSLYIAVVPKEFLRITLTLYPFVVRLLSVCCSLLNRTTIRQQSNETQTKIGTKFWHHRRNIQKTPNKFGYSFVYS